MTQSEALPRLAHRTLCVSDLAVSRRFYEQVFGFRPLAPASMLSGDWLDRASGLTDAALEMCRLGNAQGVELCLICFAKPPPSGTRSRRPMNERGLTHINFYVRDFDATLADVRAHGGQVHAQTRVDSGAAGASSSMIYCTDPDGIRVEVWTTEPYGSGGMGIAIPGVDRKFSHSGICVADPVRAAHFYAVLGFALAEQFDYREPPGMLDRILELDGSALLAQMTRNGDDVVEFLSYRQPATLGSGSAKAANQIGFRSLAYWVADIDATVAALQSVGGRPVANSRSAHGGFEQAQMIDPDGVTIELLCRLRSS